MGHLYHGKLLVITRGYINEISHIFHGYINETYMVNTMVWLIYYGLYYGQYIYICINEKSPMFSHHEIAPKKSIPVATQPRASRRLLLRHGDDVVGRLEAAARGVRWAGGLDVGNIMDIS